MRKYYKIFRIDIPTLEAFVDDDWRKYELEEYCLVQNHDAKYETEEEAEMMLKDYLDNFPERVKNKEYVILKCYKMEDR